MARWLIVRMHVGAVEAQLSQLAQEIPAVAALTTVPGVSVVCASTLVAELGILASFASPRQVLKLAGMNLAGRRVARRSTGGSSRRSAAARPSGDSSSSSPADAASRAASATSSTPRWWRATVAPR